MVHSCWLSSEQLIQPHANTFSCPSVFKEVQNVKNKKEEKQKCESGVSPLWDTAKQQHNGRISTLTETN